MVKMTIEKMKADACFVGERGGHVNQNMYKEKIRAGVLCMGMQCTGVWWKCEPPIKKNEIYYSEALFFLEGPNGYGGDRLGPPKRPNCERRPARPAGTLRPKSRHQIDRIVRGMGCRNAPERSGTLGSKMATKSPEL
eukprot:GEMP01077597.1.p2 GENE.GEMP01077597.1~~GEMP01077597.1.p2  ORF type:complete len:137 (-),score=12.25 GEMP01077597.1:14-424(-)